MTPLLTEVGFLARRSARRTLRQPALVVPTIVFPLVLLAVNSSGLADATRIPGFPTDSYLEFAITVPFMQGARWIHAVASWNPLTAIVEAGRGYVSGRPDVPGLAFACGAALVALFLVWAIGGLRRAERGPA